VFSLNLPGVFSLNLSAMPTQEINEAIAALESQLNHYENLLEKSITDNVILAKTKVILLRLKEVSQELNELKKLKRKK
jgi:hypothetical protein